MGVTHSYECIDLGNCTRLFHLSGSSIKAPPSNDYCRPFVHTAIECNAHVYHYHVEIIPLLFSFKCNTISFLSIIMFVDGEKVQVDSLPLKL